MRFNAPPGALEKLRRWNDAVAVGSYVHVLDPKRPWTGVMESLAFINDDNRVVARVTRSQPGESSEILQLPIDMLRPIGKAYTG